LKDTPAKIWEQTKDYSGISTEFYFQYYAGKNLAIALAVTDVVEYKHPIDPYENFVNFRAPQSYIYTDLVLPFK
jgi:predicted transcriptional regulator